MRVAQQEKRTGEKAKRSGVKDGIFRGVKKCTIIDIFVNYQYRRFVCLFVITICYKAVCAINVVLV